MTLTGLAIRNLTRNRFRVVLTIFGVSVMILTFLLIRTVNWSWGAAAAFAAKDRVVTRHKVTFVMSLPKRYVQQVKNSPHVKQVTFANWFGGKDPKHDREFFSTLGVDNATYFDVYNELSVPPEQLATFQHDKQGAIVGDVLAKKLGWKVGDKVPLESGIYPGDWEFHIDGIYTTTAHSVDRSTLLFHWDYMNDALPDARKDGVGWIVSRVDDPSLAADVGEPPPVPVDLVHLRPVDRLPPVGREAGRGERLGLVRERRVLHEPVGDVDPEAVHAPVEPEAEDLLEVAPHLRVVPVEVGLLRREQVEVVLAALGVERPGGAAPVGRPVVRQPVRRRHGDVAGAVAREPRVRDRRVVRDDVDEDAQAECVRIGDERVEVGERPEERVDVDVVRNVVAVVGARRGIEGRQPDRVDAELAEVREA